MAEAIAKTLFDAWKAQQSVGGSADLAQLSDVERGRAVQSDLHQMFVDAGRKPIGWKIGLTSQPALDMFGAEEPMVGVIYADSLLDDGAKLATTDTISPRIEGEMLLEIGASPASPGASDAELVSSLASVSAAFEIADSRIEGWPSAVGGAIADNACCGYLMRATDRVAPDRADFTGTAMSIRAGNSIISQIISQGQASACLGSVLDVYRWFVDDSYKRGRMLHEGELVLTGAMGPAIPMEPGMTYHLECKGLGQATLQFRDAA